MWAFLKGKTFSECHKKWQGTSGEVDIRKFFTQTFQLKMCTSAYTTKKSIHKTTSPQWKKGLANITKENCTKNRNNAMYLFHTVDQLWNQIINNF